MHRNRKQHASSAAAKGTAKGSGTGKNVCRMGVGVIAGGLLFVGSAQAAPIISESFEATPSDLFGAFSSYAYSENYTSSSTPPGGGDRYFTGDSGVALGTREATVSLIELASGGVPAVAIDTGIARYNLSAYFSTYMAQTDFSEVRVQFTDQEGNPIGEVVTIGGQTFVAALPFAPNAAGVAGHRGWGFDDALGVIPAGARSADVTILTQRFQGTAADGYLDLLTLDVTVVPEPGGFGMAALAAAVVGLRRRRRTP